MEKLQLSDEHARWLEDERKIPCELAAEMGVVSKGPNLAFEYRQNGAVSFIKVRQETWRTASRPRRSGSSPRAPSCASGTRTAMRDPQPGAR